MRFERKMINTTNNKKDAISNQETGSSGVKKNFDEVLHKLLIIGLGLSVLLILFGLVLSLVKQEPIPTTVPSLNIVVAQVLSLQSSGFLVLGILVLIATPIVRVISSIIAFIIEKDWRFAGITLIVLLTVIASILTGTH